MSSSGELAEAHAELRKAVPGKRRAFDADLGPLARTYKAAMEIWDAQKADGVSLLERIAGLTKTLRAAWPQTREWKYLCNLCEDRGLEMLMCPGDRSCGRDREHLPHDYGRACLCSAGNRFKRPAPTEADYTQAAKSKPVKKGFQRWNG